MNGCFRCGSPEHWAGSCPHNARAKDRADHESRIAEYVERFFADEITPREKQLMIKAENQQWYGKEMPAALRR